MKGFKKVLALLTAAAITISIGTVSVFASGDVTGDGDTKYIDTDITEVILPTSSAWNFVLDPQGLEGLASGSSAGLDTLNGGGIIPTGTAPLAVNKSSYDMSLRVELKVTGDANVVATDTAVEADNGNNILLNVIASTADVNTAGGTFAGTVETALSTSGTDIQFVLAPAAYEVKNTAGVYTYERVAADDGHGTELQLGGKVNTKADWSAFTGTTPAKKVGITAKFTLSKATDAEKAAPKATGAYGMLVTPIEPVATLLSGASGSAALTELTSLATNVVFRIDGVKGTATDLTSLFIGDVPLTKGTHYTVANATDGRIQVTIIGGKPWLSSTKSTDVSFTVEGKSYSITLSKVGTNEATPTGPAYSLLSGATGSTPLTSLTVVGPTVSFRINGLTGKTAADLTSITAGGVPLTKGTHFSVTVTTDDLLQVTFTATSAWLATAKSSGNDTLVVVVSGDTLTFDIAYN